MEESYKEKVYKLIKKKFKKDYEKIITGLNNELIKDKEKILEHQVELFKEKITSLETQLNNSKLYKSTSTLNSSIFRRSINKRLAPKPPNPTINEDKVFIQVKQLEEIAKKEAKHTQNCEISIEEPEDYYLSKEEIRKFQKRDIRWKFIYKQVQYNNPMFRNYRIFDNILHWRHTVNGSRNTYRLCLPEGLTIKVIKRLCLGKFRHIVENKVEHIFDYCSDKFIAKNLKNAIYQFCN